MPLTRPRVGFETALRGFLNLDAVVKLRRLTYSPEESKERVMLAYKCKPVAEELHWILVTVLGLADSGG
jgi:hypothetical protein